MGDEADAIVDRLSNPDPLAGVRTRRCRHELIKDQCGLCTPRVRPAHEFSDDPFGSATDHVPFRNTGPGSWFPAQFPGECAGCGSDFDEDDDIRADGSGGWEGRCCE